MARATLVLICGPPCSGKSTLAAEIALQTGWPHLSMDAVRERILPDALHTREDRTVAYRAMALAAELLLQAGRNVILDAPYGHRDDREGIATLLKTSGARLQLIQCRVSVETALSWFAERDPGPRLDLNAARVREMVDGYPYASGGLIIDTGNGRSFQALAGETLKSLRRSPPCDVFAWAAAAKDE